MLNGYIDSWRRKITLPNSGTARMQMLINADFVAF
jgi:hypothetical protein